MVNVLAQCFQISKIRRLKEFFRVLKIKSAYHACFQTHLPSFQNTGIKNRMKECIQKKL